MRTYSEIQEERVMKALQEAIELNISTRFSIQPQELLQIVEYLALDDAKITKAQLAQECIDLVRRVATAKIPTPGLASAIVKLYHCGLIDRTKMDMLTRLQEDRL